MKARTFVSDLHLVVPFKVVQSDINIYSDLTASTKSCLPFIETAIVTSLYQTRVVSGFKANILANRFPFNTSELYPKQLFHWFKTSIVTWLHPSKVASILLKCL